MYMPPHFAETDPAVLKALIRAHPLGTWVVPDGGTLIVNHIPFLLRDDGVLVGHVARANDVWKKLGAESVVVFQGAEAYITPSWYATKHEHGKVVPTWNYAVVHAHGKARLMDEAGLHDVVTRLSSKYEAGNPKPWRLSDQPPAYVAGMLQNIVGFEIAVERLEGKFKLSQNRPAEIARVIDALEKAGETAIATLMKG